VEQGRQDRWNGRNLLEPVEPLEQSFSDCCCGRHTF
jgi:hypothetical protein